LWYKELQIATGRTGAMLLNTMQKTMTNGLTSFVCGFCEGGGYAPEILYAQAGRRLLRLPGKPGDGASHERPKYGRARPGRGPYRGIRLA
jgi:hypothetical protein